MTAAGMQRSNHNWWDISCGRRFGPFYDLWCGNCRLYKDSFRSGKILRLFPCDTPDPGEREALAAMVSRSDFTELAD